MAGKIGLAVGQTGCGIIIVSATTIGTAPTVVIYALSLTSTRSLTVYIG